MADALERRGTRNRSRPAEAAALRDEHLAGLLRDARTIAVVGIKSDPNEDAYRVPHYLQQCGYRIVPINPKLERVLDERAYASLSELTNAADESGGPSIDIVNLFRASEHVPAHVDEILALEPKPRAVWMQLGIHHGEAAGRLREANIEVVQDRCIMVDHRRLVARRDSSAGGGS